MAEMVKIDSKSAQPEALPENLNVHTDTPTQIGVISDYYSIVTPVNSIDGTNTIDFKICSSLNQVIDPSKTLMRFKFKVLKEGGKTTSKRTREVMIADTEDKTKKVQAKDKDGQPKYEPIQDNIVLPVNNIVQSMWSNVMVKINNQIMSNGDSAYPYRADIESKFMTTKDGKKNLAPGMWYEEKVPWEDRPDKPKADAAEHFMLLDSDEKDPIQIRYDLGHMEDTDGTMHVQGPIHSEIFETNKVLPPGTTMNVIFTKSDPRFCLLAEREMVGYKIEIFDFELLVHFLNVDAEIISDMLYHTQKKAFVYPLRKVDIKWITVNKDVNSINETNLLHEKEKLPRRMFIAFVNQNAFNQPGSLALDPFHYHHLEMSESTLRVGNRERPYPTIKYHWPCIPDHMFALQHATSTLYSDDYIGYNPVDIKARNFVIPYKLSPTDSKAGECYEMLPHEVVFFSAQLKKATDKVYQMIIYAEYDAEMHINEHGRISVLV